LTVPTAKPVVDFHHQVIAHAGRTTNNPHLFSDGDFVYALFRLRYDISIPLVNCHLFVLSS
ncbi:hypothetical protein ACFQ1Y_06585, partial [Virgibacillus alimentarius]